MFTGIVESQGVIDNLEFYENNGGIIIVSSELSSSVGDSIAIDGCCLTVEEIQGDRMKFSMSEETLNKTNMQKSSRGKFVNMERAMKAQARFDGHFVSGHIDETGTVQSCDQRGSYELLTINLTHNSHPYIVDKGSICVNGVSLTINNIDQNQDGSVVSLTVIPKTLELTNLSKLASGDLVNVEYDLIGKYIYKQTKAYS